jgi:hypothetical protein
MPTCFHRRSGYDHLRETTLKRLILALLTLPMLSCVTTSAAGWRRFDVPQAPGNSHCAPTAPGNSHCAPPELLISARQPASQFPLRPCSAPQFPSHPYTGTLNGIPRSERRIRASQCSLTA